MEIQRGVQLGLLHQQLGINPNARVSFQLTHTGVIIWDYDTGTQYTVDKTIPSVAQDRFEVPRRMKEIFNATDEELKKRWDDGWMNDWADERQTIFAELCMRGVNMLPGH